METHPHDLEDVPPHVVATCTGPSSIKLTKAELDEFYTFLFGDTTMGREPTPSLGVLMTAERKAWRLLCLAHG